MRPWEPRTYRFGPFYVTRGSGVHAALALAVTILAVFFLVGLALDAASPGGLWDW